MVSSWIKNMVPWKIVSKNTLQENKTTVDKLNSTIRGLEYNLKRAEEKIKESEEQMAKLMPAIYGLSSKPDYKDRLLYLTVTIDSDIFFTVPQYQGSMDYIADMISYSIRKEISTINLTRVPDYCRTIKSARNSIRGNNIKDIINDIG